MNSRALSVSVVGIAALVLLIASGPIVAAHQASAFVYRAHTYIHGGHYYRPYHGCVHITKTIRGPHGGYIHKSVTFCGGHPRYY